MPILIEELHPQPLVAQPMLEVVLIFIIMDWF